MRPTIGVADRLIRAFAVAPGALVVAALAAWMGGWAIVFVAVAGIMVVTAAVGYGPLYALFGIDTLAAERWREARMAGSVAQRSSVSRTRRVPSP